jgi:hypothetical protein
MIKCGKRKHNDFHLYLFEDQDLRQELEKAKLNHKFTPIDLLYEYGKVYHFEMGGRSMITEIPKKAEDEAIGLYMFPKRIRS